MAKEKETKKKNMKMSAMLQFYENQQFKSETSKEESKMKSFVLAYFTSSSVSLSHVTNKISP